MGAIHPIGLRQPACSAGEGAHLARVDHRHRQAGRGQGRREADLQAAGGFEHDERRLEGGQALDQHRHLLLAIIDREALAGRAQMHIEPVLGDIDADERGNLVHDPVSLDTGLLALVTVRVARTRPAGRQVVARPCWTDGKAGSRRP
jgi:hypothetical protein